MEVVDIVVLRAQFLQRLHEVLRDAEASFENEYNASTRIQSVFRGWRVRTHLAEFHYYAREIQRIFRGHMGRKRCRIELDVVFEARREAVRHWAAGVIQRHFKGWYSRKHTHDYYARKAYIAAISAKSESLRAELEASLAAQLRSHLEKEESKQREEFDKLTRGLHHLVSTKAQPGVYNPPWAATMDAVPSAFGVPLETHLRLGVLRELRTTGLYPASRTAALQATLTGKRPIPEAEMVDPTTGLLKAPTETAAAATQAGLGAGPLAAVGHRNVLLVPSYISNDKRSLQASVPYDTVLEANRKERRHSKYRFLDQKPFIAGNTANIIGQMPGIGVNAADPYVEQHLRERFTKEVEHLTSKHLRTSQAPFIPASSTASRLFEDTERRRVVQAAALLAHVTSPHAQRVGLTGNTTVAREFNVTKGTVGLGPTMANSAIITGTASSAVVAGIPATRTLRQGHVVAVVRADPVSGRGKENEAKEMDRHAGHNPKSPWYSEYGQNAAVTGGGFAVGSGAAAVRRARKSNVPPRTGSTSPSPAERTRSPLRTQQMAPAAEADGAVPAATSTLLLSRGRTASSAPFAVTVNNVGASAPAPSALNPAQKALLGLDSRGLLTHAPGTEAAAATLSGGSLRRPARPLMKPPQAVSSNTAASRSSRLAAAMGALPFVQPGPEPTPVEMAM